MKNQINIILLSLLIVATTMQAQTPLTAARNSFRDGDRIVKQEIEYMSPGRVGSKYDGGYGLNDMRSLFPHGDNYNQYMYSHNGSATSIIRDVRIDAVSGIFWSDYHGTSLPVSFNGFFFWK